MPATLRTNSVAEFSLGVTANIGFQVVPDALLVANLPAASANGKQPAQGTNLREGLLQLPNQKFALFFCGSPLADIAHDDACSEFAFGIPENNGRDLHWKNRPVFALGGQFAVSPACAFAFSHHLREARIGGIDDSASASGNNLFAWSTQNPARGGVGVNNRTVGRGQEKSVEPVLK